MSIPEYHPTYLFERYDAFKTTDDRRLYIEDEMSRMAREGSLYLTDLYNQRGIISQTCGEIILGRKIMPSGDVEQVETPPDIESYRVRIKSVNDWKITIKLPHKPSENRIVKSMGFNGSQVYAGIKEERVGASSKLVPEMISTGKTEVDLSIKRAWWLLRQSGAHCKKAYSASAQNSWWKCYEVRPDVVASSDPLVSPEEALLRMQQELADLKKQVEKQKKPTPKKKPGRPKKKAVTTAEAAVVHE